MKNTILAALAALVVAVGFTPAAAQSLNLNLGVKHVGATITPTASPINLVAIAHGVALRPEEADIALKHGCFVGPIETTEGLYQKADKKGVIPCSPRFYAMVDDFIAKESTIGYVLARVADGWEHCPIRKASNRGNNRDRCVNYPFDASQNPAGMVGRFADANWSTGGDTATADAMVALGGAAILGPVTAFVGNKTAPDCCGPQVVNQLTATAGAQNVNQNAIDVFSGVTVSGAAPCGAACQPATAPKK